jgi:hypothetical protein
MSRNARFRVEPFYLFFSHQFLISNHL